MAKRRKKKEEQDDRPAVTRGVFVTWRNALNCDRSHLQTAAADFAATAARDAGYEFMVYNHEVYHVPKEGAAVKAGFGSDKLDGGVVVNFVNDTIANTDVKRKKMYVVTRIAWNYDDENYSTNENSGFPTAVFDDRDEADRIARQANIDEIVDCDPLDYFHYDDEFTFDRVINMSWPVWRDWLLDRGIDPPDLDISDDEDKVDREVFREWWSANSPSRTWVDGEGWVDAAGVWTKEQLRAAAEHINLDFYEVYELDYNG